MIKGFTYCIICFFVCLTAFSQNVKDTNNRYTSVFADLKGFSADSEALHLFNVGFKSVSNIATDNTKFQNFATGLEFGLIAAPSADITTLRLAFVLGYDYALSNQFVLFPNIKPNLNYTISNVVSADSSSGFGTTEEYAHDFGFDALLGLEMRYFFSQDGRFGVTAELLTTFNGGYGFNAGLVWRKKI